MNYEGCARPFPAPETKYDAVNSSFTTLDTTDSRPSPWNITSSSTIGANRIGNEQVKMIVIQLCGSIIQWIAKNLDG